MIDDEQWEYGWETKMKIAGYKFTLSQIGMKEYVKCLAGLGLDNFAIVREIKWIKKQMKRKKARGHNVINK